MLPTNPKKAPSTDDEQTVSSLSRDENEKQGPLTNGDGLVEAKSRGVRRMEYLSARLDNKYRFFLYSGFALLAYVMSLDQYTAGTYRSTATSVSFSAHSTLATINVLRSVFQSVSQPPLAKLSDVIGRVETYCICVFLYALGYIIVASSPSIYVYAVGNSIYIWGITGLFLLQNIIISDISSLRNRLFWSIFPSVPGVINVWLSGNVASAILKNDLGNWRWGIGMFCILTPVLACPIIGTLAYGMRKPVVQKDASMTHQEELERAAAKLTFKQRASQFFWQLDFVGLVLLVGGVGLCLVTITIANQGVSKWSDGHTIAMLVVGGVVSVAFVLWEKYGARHPLIPFALLKNRTVIVCLIIDMCHPAHGAIINGYLYTFFVVAANQSVLSATRLAALTSFTATLTAFVAGVAARYIRYLKPIIIFGFLVEILAIGLMIRFRRATNSTGEIAIVQILRGLGGGCISFPTQAAIQSAAKHEYTASITASSLLVFYLFSGVGSAIGGGIWTNVVPRKINEYMNNPTLAASAYRNPFGFIKTYAVGTFEHDALARAQDETQRIMILAGLAVACVGLLAALFLQNIRLPDTQSVEDDGEAVIAPSTGGGKTTLKSLFSFRNQQQQTASTGL